VVWGRATRVISVGIAVCLLSCLLLSVVGCSRTGQGSKAVPKQSSLEEFKAGIDKTKMMGGGPASKPRLPSGGGPGGG